MKTRGGEGHIKKLNLALLGEVINSQGTKKRVREREREGEKKL